MKKFLKLNLAVFVFFFIVSNDVFTQKSQIMPRGLLLHVEGDGVIEDRLDVGFIIPPDPLINPLIHRLATLHVTNRPVLGGPNSSAILGTRHHNVGVGGINWSTFGVDAIIKGLNGDKDNPIIGDFTTGVAGYTAKDSTTIHAGVIGASYDGTICGALTYSDSDKIYSGYFTGADVCIAGGHKLVIGDVSTPSGYQLYVKEGILTEKVKVAISSSGGWSDFVFDDDYDLQSLASVKDFIKKNKHLPNVPSAKKVAEEGIDVAEMDATLLRQIEELWLHLFEKDENIQQLKEEVKQLKEMFFQLQMKQND